MNNTYDYLLNGDGSDTTPQASSAQQSEGDSQKSTQQTASTEPQTQYVRTYSHHSGAELCKQPKAVPYLIKSYMRKGGLGMIYGESGCGKSFTVIDMAASIATEEIESWHGHKINHGPVIIFAGEGADGLNARLACWCSQRNINPDSLRLEVIDEIFKLDCGNEDPEHNLDTTIAEIKAAYPEPALVIFDTVNIFMKAEENSNTDVGRFCSACRKIIHECGCTVLVAHHTGLNTEAKNRARGASALKGAMDFELRLTKSGTLLTLSTTKIKDGKEQPDLLFNLRQHEIPEWFDEDGEPVTSCTIELATDLMQYREAKGKEGKEKALCKTAIQARKTFAETAKHSGRLIKDEHTSHDIAIVEVEDWRKTAYAMSSADNDSTKRSQFKNQREELFEKGELLTKKIIEGREYYCLDLNGETEPELRAQIRLAIWDGNTQRESNASGGGKTTNDTPGTLFDTP